MDDFRISHELDLAAKKAVAARVRVEEIPPHSADYQPAVIAYLQATVLHLSIVSVAQARQFEWLVAEVEDLKETLGSPPGGLH
jgi:hypothetical protein